MTSNRQQGVRMPSQQRDDGVLVAVAGASRSGKSAFVKIDTREHARVLVWDVRREYPREGFKSADTHKALIDATDSSSRGRWAFHPPGGQARDFEFFCRVALLWGQLWPCTVIVDELAEVTHPGKAPPAWHKLVTQGAHWGIWVYGISQSPAESDKTIWRNAHRLRCFRMVADQDRAYMARRMGIDPAQLPVLPLEWVERDQDAQITSGKLVF